MSKALEGLVHDQISSFAESQGVMDSEALRHFFRDLAPSSAADLRLDGPREGSVSFSLFQFAGSRIRLADEGHLGFRPDTLLRAYQFETVCGLFFPS